LDNCDIVAKFNCSIDLQKLNPDSLTVQMLKTKLGLMDVKEISLDEWPGLFMDMLAGDKGLLRRVFGWFLSLSRPPFPLPSFIHCCVLCK